MEALLPILTLVLGAYLSFALLRMRPDKPMIGGIVSTLFAFVSFMVTIWLGTRVWAGETISQQIGSAVFSLDSLGVALALLATAMAALISTYSLGYMKHEKRLETYYPLLLLMVTGVVGIGFATDFLTLFVFFELMAVTSYALVTFKKHKRDAVEAGVKYVILSAAGSAIALFGISLIYGQTGTLSIDGAFGTIRNTSMSMVAVIMLLIGFGVKAAIVPLHTWLPDAHSAAPSGISAMLSGIVIQAGFIALVKTLIVFQAANISVGLLLIGFALLTMTVGNMLAFTQVSVKKADLKRVLAYSSIAQMGYIILGFGLWMEYGTIIGLQGSLFHIMTHAFMKGLAFLTAGLIIYRLGTRELAKMRGIGHLMPVTAFCFTIAALSLAGAPPLSGFMSEWMIFRAGVDAAEVIGGWGILITLIAIINSIISLGYYMPIIKTFFLKPKRKWVGVKETPMSMMIPILLMTSITITLGIWPELGLRVIQPVVDALTAIGGI